MGPNLPRAFWLTLYAEMMVSIPFMVAMVMRDQLPAILSYFFSFMRLFASPKIVTWFPPGLYLVAVMLVGAHAAWMAHWECLVWYDLIYSDRTLLLAKLTFTSFMGLGDCFGGRGRGTLDRRS